MNDEAESSRAGRRSSSAAALEAEHEYDNSIADLVAQQEQRAKERRLDAKRKRVVFLDHLLRELDTLVFLELIALYHLEYICPQYSNLRSRY